MANTLTFANDTLTDANIYGGINYICDLNTGDEFSIGNTASASVSFVTDVQLPIYTKDAVNGTFVWEQDSVTRGRFYITEVTRDKDKYMVTAYDAMILLETSISVLSFSFPVTVSAAASAIATYLGCTISGTIYNGTMAADSIEDTTTIREVLGWVAEASGCSVKIDGSDHLCFMYYADSGITVSASEYKEDGLNVADYTCAAIDNVTILDMAGMTHATAGSGTNSLFIMGNPFMYDATNTEAAVILSLVEDFEYAPFTCEMFEENGLEVGTIATFGTTETLVMHIESGEDGAAASAVGSDSRAELNKSLDVMVNEALTTAASLSQHFWYTASGSEAGAHIAEVDKATFEDNPSGGNLLSTSSGIAVRDGLTELAVFGRGSGADNGRIGIGALLTADNDSRVTIDDWSGTNLSQGDFTVKYKDGSMASASRGRMEVTATSGQAKVRISASGAGHSSAYIDIASMSTYPDGGIVLEARKTMLSLSTNPSSGDDYALYQAITALGWRNDVIV